MRQELQALIDRVPTEGWKWIVTDRGRIRGLYSEETYPAYCPLTAIYKAETGKFRTTLLATALYHDLGVSSWDTSRVIQAADNKDAQEVREVRAALLAHLHLSEGAPNGPQE